MMLLTISWCLSSKLHHKIHKKTVEFKKFIKPNYKMKVNHRQNSLKLMLILKNYQKSSFSEMHFVLQLFGSFIHAYSIVC